MRRELAQPLAGSPLRLLAARELRQALMPILVFSLQSTEEHTEAKQLLETGFQNFTLLDFDPRVDDDAWMKNWAEGLRQLADGLASLKDDFEPVLRDTELTRVVEFFEIAKTRVDVIESWLDYHAGKRQYDRKLEPAVRYTPYLIATRLRGAIEIYRRLVH